MNRKVRSMMRKPKWSWRPGWGWSYWFSSPDNLHYGVKGMRWGMGQSNMSGRPYLSRRQLLHKGKKP